MLLPLLLMALGCSVHKMSHWPLSHWPNFPLAHCPVPAAGLQAGRCAQGAGSDVQNRDDNMMMMT
jgi:hypothetical protein